MWQLCQFVCKVNVLCQKRLTVLQQAGSPASWHMMTLATTYCLEATASSSSNGQTVVIVDYSEAFVSSVENRCAILQYAESYPRGDGDAMATALQVAKATRAQIFTEQVLVDVGELQRLTDLAVHLHSTARIFTARISIITGKQRQNSPLSLSGPFSLLLPSRNFFYIYMMVHRNTPSFRRYTYCQQRLG